MSLKKCKECGNEVSTKAASCPKCGAVLKTKVGCSGCLGWGLLIFVILVIIGYFTNDITRKSSSSNTSSASSKTEPTAEKKVYKEGDSVHIGYTTYAVWQSWWSSKLSSNEFLDQRPNAMYLFVELMVRNDDKKARMVPPFKLVDENGAEYEASSNGWAVEGSIGILESLNPSVSKQGFVVFDVPKGRTYRLKLSGGYWSLEDAYVQLSPKQSR
jgi:hypothetical protein